MKHVLRMIIGFSLVFIIFLLPLVVQKYPLVLLLIAAVIATPIILILSYLAGDFVISKLEGCLRKSGQDPRLPYSW
jgi:hypothetical protein